MMNFISRLIRRDGATVPSMDGVLRPNSRLDGAPVLAAVAEPDNLVTSGDDLVFSSANALYRLTPASNGEPAQIQAFDADVTALAAHPDGALAVGVSGEGIRIIGGAHDGVQVERLGSLPAFGPTALCFDGPHTLFAAIGSAHNGPEEWQRDLMERRSSGSIWRIDLKTRAATAIAEGLAFPNGLLVHDGALVVSESWNHRLLRFELQKPKPRPQIVVDDLPGYPGRLSVSADGGAWLAVFAPRSQLIEFVLRERGYCSRMLEGLPREYWIAPTLRSGLSFREPMQGGAVRVHGIYKPWAPTRSYGLAVRLGPDLQPLQSLHSRADGARHGIVSLCEWNGVTAFASRGDGVIGAIAPDKGNPVGEVR